MIYGKKHKHSGILSIHGSNLFHHARMSDEEFREYLRLSPMHKRRRR